MGQWLGSSLAQKNQEYASNPASSAGCGGSASAGGAENNSASCAAVCNCWDQAEFTKSVHTTIAVTNTIGVQYFLSQSFLRRMLSGILSQVKKILIGSVQLLDGDRSPKLPRRDSQLFLEQRAQIFDSGKA
jgi:hypothetical protein